MVAEQFMCGEVRRKCAVSIQGSNPDQEYTMLVPRFSPKTARTGLHEHIAASMSVKIAQFTSKT
jgi:hypothetical protein